MIVRIVKMNFDPEKLEAFYTIFNQKKEFIRGFPGCIRMSLLEDAQHPNLLFTISEWESESDLNAYRKSELFQKTWEQVKLLFQGPPEAHTLNLRDTPLQ